MKNFINIILIPIVILALTGCARDLSNTTYTSDSTMNIVLEGVIVSARDIKIKESDRLKDNTLGGGAGAVGGGLAASRGTGNSVAILGGVVAGGLAGALVEQGLSTAKGVEYIVKVDRSQISSDFYEGSAMIRNALSAAKTTGAITVIQSPKGREELRVGTHALIIVSDKKSMVIPDKSK